VCPARGDSGRALIRSRASFDFVTAIRQPITTFIVDDEPSAREGVRMLLERDPDLVVTGEYGNGATAAAAVEDQQPDLLILDIQMPDLDGFQCLDRIPAAQRPAVVFLTAYEQYAVRAFEVQAADYVLKPFSDARLEQAVARAKDRILERRNAAGEQYLTRIVARHAKGSTVIDTGEVDWIEGANYYARVHAGTQAHLVRESLDRLEADLDPRAFMRVHRSAVVNLQRVLSLEVAGDGSHEIVLRSGARVPLSRRRRKAVEAALRQLRQP
jgi:two-component system LytT family response regulator